MAELTEGHLGSLPETIVRPDYDRSRVTAGLAHFSVGNFHRAHQAVYLDRCLHRPGQADWGILGIGLIDDARERAKADGLPQQDNLYSLTEYTAKGEPSVRVVGSIVEYLHAPDDPGAVLTRLLDPRIRIVSMTVTEGGYNIDETTGMFRLDHPAVVRDLANPDAPTTVFGFVVQALARRRAIGIAPFTVLSCDNLRHNGDVARLAFLSFARALDSELADWMAESVTFPNCMVDRITPATNDADKQRLNRASGIEDRLPVFAESFIQWVVEDKFVAGRPDLLAVGVQMTDDVRVYEAVKLRMLNASHNMLAFPGLCIGYRLAHKAMADPLFPKLLGQFMESDVIPILQSPADVDLQDYKQMVIDRFANPAIGDQLLRIASDGAAKIPVFLQDTLRTAVGQSRDTTRLSFIVACFVRYLTGMDDKGIAFPIVEPNLTQSDRLLAAEPGAAPLGMSLFAGWGLQDSAQFVAQFVAARQSLADHGTRATLAALLN